MLKSKIYHHHLQPINSELSEIINSKYEIEVVLMEYEINDEIIEEATRLEKRIKTSVVSGSIKGEYFNRLDELLDAPIYYSNDVIYIGISCNNMDFFNLHVNYFAKVKLSNNVTISIIPIFCEDNIISISPFFSISTAFGLRDNYVKIEITDKITINEFIENNLISNLNLFKTDKNNYNYHEIIMSIIETFQYFKSVKIDFHKDKRFDLYFLFIKMLLGDNEDTKSIVKDLGSDEASLDIIFPDKFGMNLMNYFIISNINFLYKELGKKEDYAYRRESEDEYGDPDLIYWECHGCDMEPCRCGNWVRPD